MIQTTIRELKDGQFFTFRPHEYPKERQVYVRSRYDRSGKKFAYFPYSDMMDEHFAKGSRVVFTDFIFWFMNIKLTKQETEIVFKAIYEILFQVLFCRELVFWIIKASGRKECVILVQCPK